MSSKEACNMEEAWFVVVVGSEASSSIHPGTNELRNTCTKTQTFLLHHALLSSHGSVRKERGRLKSVTTHPSVKTEVATTHANLERK